jgi:hypothetical protein
MALMPMHPTPANVADPEGESIRRGVMSALSGRRLLAQTRRNWLFLVLVTAGLVLRVLAQVAYRPALLFIDSIKYLYGAYPGNDPPGYQLGLRAFLAVGNLPAAVAIQHLLGLAMAIALYVLLLRRGVPRWLAALATAPVLLDAYQLQIEQSIMPDTLFEALIVAGLVIMLWRPRPVMWMVVAGGLLLGASATVRQIGEVFILPALIFVLVVGGNWRGRLTKALALCLAFAFPILFMSFRNYLAIKSFSLAPYASATIYGRAAAAADCATLRLPASEQSLCPTPQQQAMGPDWLDHGAGSPIKTFKPPPGMRHVSVATDFSRRVFLQQPLPVAVAIAKDAIKLFAIQRVTSPGDTSIARWQFQRGYPLYPPYITIHNGQLQYVALTPTGHQRIIASGQQFGGGQPAVSKSLASFLRAYQLDGGYTPGPLLLVALLAGLAGSATVLRRRASPGQRASAQACLLIFLSGAAVLLASDIFEFSWRYQLPALVTLPPAGALGVTVVIGYIAGRRRRPAGGQAASNFQSAVPPASPPADERPAQQRKDRASAG